MKQKKLSYAKYGYLFSLPFVIAFALFSLYPILYTLVIGFTDLKGMGKSSFHFLADPLQNFKVVLSAPTFHKALKNTVFLWVSNFIPQVLLALLLTAWFTDRSSKVKAQGLFKVLFYMPNIITAATISILFYAMFGYPMGPMNDLLARLAATPLGPIFHIPTKPVYFLQSKAIAKGVVIFIQTWMWYGYTMIILISGVLGISPEIFEAAEVDGAGKWQTFFQITLPNIRPILLFTLVTSLIGGLSMFDIPKLFLMGGPDNATLTTSVYIYNQAFSGSYLYNRAAAASIIMFIIMGVCSAILFFLMRDKDEVKMNKIKKQQEKLRREQMKQRRKEASV